MVPAAAGGGPVRLLPLPPRAQDLDLDGFGDERLLSPAPPAELGACAACVAAVKPFNKLRQFSAAVHAYTHAHTLRVTAGRLPGHPHICIARPP